MSYATVTQVDGTIIPQTGALQGYLDAEGETLDAVLDAAELPQVFLPNTSGLVDFSDIAEGAGFENSFGWYNVGDDVLSPTGRALNLHPIFGCGVPIEDHAYDPGDPAAHDDHLHGDPAYYFQDAEPGDSISVDFGQELLAGRYKGGFIGFYLITPEDHPDGGTDNCGDADYLNRGDMYFGYIYFTQKDLNDDGDFVHHLVYTSDQASDRYYFGFEDLFRGGDNDFEDMLIRVDGLTPPCVPTTEVCDGVDNDCDMLIDADDPDLTGIGDPCVCDGAGETCADGVVFGACQMGETICVGGEIQCTSTTPPSPELCDGLDNDCNNNVDDAPTDVGGSCDGPDADLCPEGTIVCDTGSPVCSDATGPNAELCNDVDDDCDGATDESPIDEGGSCGTDVGICSSGTEVCVAGGTLECQGETTGEPETCNGLDDDCDGIADNNPVDVNMQCGQTDTGTCEYGTTICNGGVLECAGEIGPIPELCNVMDDDCDGVVDNDPIDVGSPCGSDVGVCEPGAIVCTATGPECQGETGGGQETCNSLDDDCNGLVDDDPVDEGGVCGEGDGVCEPGIVECIDGALECVGGYEGTTETCNALDDDCDGMIDEGDLCEGGVCGDGVCSTPCEAGEFPCPIDQRCEDGFCVDDPCFGLTCPDGPDGERQVCVEGECVSLCDTVSCPGDLVCRDGDGVCVPDNCDFLPLCEDGEICRDSECVDDPCAGVDCPTEDGQFCREGECVDSCAGVECAVGERCTGGACVPTACPDGCAPGQVCIEASGECVADPCAGESCPPNDVCDPQTGECIDDPCVGIECPREQEVCRLGDCFDAPEGDAGPDELVTAAGGGGCASGGGSGTWLLALAFAGLACTARRRKVARAELLALAAALAVAGTSSGCNVNEFCVSCGVGADDGDGGTGTGGDAGAEIDASPDAGPGCDVGVIRAEECDELDNDCDGRVDEDFDLPSDPFNCGACGTTCLLDGARTQCDEGSCEFIECTPGNVDLDGDTGGPFQDSDGCEYGCFVSNGGAEACDELDNDCDGDADEDTDFQEDEQNCGQCGRVCSFFEVATATCDAGTCTFDRDTDCNPGFIDLDMMVDTGCEYECTPTGAEVCDLRDNDCNGNVDETFDLMMDPDNCGQCGHGCSFPHVPMPSCSLGSCVFDPMTDCASGFHDANGLQIDGCEYGCAITNGGVEICDLVDNDCNGLVDDDPVDADQACNNAPGGIATGLCTDTGLTVCSVGELVCVGAPEPQPETCDGMDEDCDGADDNGVTRPCYTGGAGTEGVGICEGGTESCVGGAFDGVCTGEQTEEAETCNNLDDDCDATIDEAGGGGPITRVCYTGTPGTEGVGTCVSGVETCSFGVFGACVGEITDTPFDVCGDGLDTDCDGLDDAAEGCTVVAGEIRLDAPGGGLGTMPDEAHSFDVGIAAGGAPLGHNLYTVWSDLAGGTSDVYFRRSTDGGATWDDIVNLTGGIGDAAVKPLLVVAPGSPDTVHVVFQTVSGGVRDVRVITSVDGGGSFGGASAALDASGDSFHHHAAVSADGQTLVVVWEQLDTGNLDRNVVSRVSTDGGASFLAARTINVGSGAGPVAGRPQAGITSGGRYVFVWREKRGGNTLDVFAAFSDSDTAPPVSDLRLDGDGGDTRDSDVPLLRVVEDDAYVVWQDISTAAGGGADVVFTRSNDGGATFDPEAIVDDPAAEVSASFTPAIAVDRGAAGPGDDRLFVAWEDRREGTQVFVAVSTDGGASFAAPVRASNSGGDPVAGITRNPVIAYAGGDVVVVAYTNDDGAGIEHVFASASIDGGATWRYTHEQLDGGAGKALTPVIAPANGGSVIDGAATAWIDFRAGSQVNGDPYVRRVGQ